jgi:hypothetical protein
MILAVLLATIFLPLLPWVFLAVVWLQEHYSQSSMIILFAGGLVLDLWWGKPLGLTDLILLGLLIGLRVLHYQGKVSPNLFRLVAVILSLIVFEIYAVVL